MRRYLETQYLSNGGLDHDKRNAQELVRRKAQRIYEVTGRTDKVDNWLQAETYSGLFYDNIVTAAVEFNKESTLRVLKAFQFSEARENKYSIITTFEAALAIYFLQPDVVKELWKESASKPVPETVVVSTIKVERWPNGFVVPRSCVSRFVYSGTEIVFRGVMSEAQRDDLAKGLSGAELKSLGDLFEKSRLIHRETTL